ncbi:MAG: hypothetical protein JNN11_01650 [Candidatus Doudnabacteria bacterium]|nr:hypothetical protein [Candidatus Doudnabacteria bacterium]
MSFLFLMVVFAMASLAHAAGATMRLSSFLRKQSLKKQTLPKAVTALMAAAQLSELASLIEHASFVHFVGAAMVLVVLLAVKSGTEEHGL